MEQHSSATPAAGERQAQRPVSAPTPVGLIGITQVDAARGERAALKGPPPRRWRFARYAMALALPAGVAFAAHRISEPEGLGTAEPVDASAMAFVTAPDSTSLQPIVNQRPPGRVFDAAAFGHSGAVRVRVALPGAVVPFPIAFTGNSDGLLMQWIGFDGKGDDALIAYPVSGTLRAPMRPGAYWLVLSRGGFADTVADMALFVEHPMPNKMATGINGYHMGRWPKASDGAVPPGFIEVTERTSDFPLSPHLKLSDFVVHDAQDGFPKYLHVREPLLDKIELTVAEVAAMRGRAPSIVRLNVASGFRSPAHNGGLSGSAQDSRHMYGDAADIAIDANNDGALTEIDARLVAAAAEAVERKHPDLVGGIGLYITPDGAGWPYVHIDVRGRRARWRGGAKRGGAVDSLPADATFDSVGTPPVTTPRTGATSSPTAPTVRTTPDPAAAAARPALP